MRSLIALALFLLVFLQSPLPRAEDTLSLATLEWPPYIGSAMPQQGYVASLVRRAYQHSETQVKLHFMPWARVVAMTRNGQFDGYLPEYYDTSLQGEFFISDPFPGGPLGFFKRKANPISWKTLDDLKPYRIGVVRGYLNTAEFDRKSSLTKLEAADDLTNLRMLAVNRLDLVVMDKYVGIHLLRTELADKQEEIEFMSPVLEEKNLYLCISKKTANAQARIEAFNQGLATIRDDGSLDRLIKLSGL